MDDSSLFLKEDLFFLPYQKYLCVQVFVDCDKGGEVDNREAGGMARPQDQGSPGLRGHCQPLQVSVG